MPDVSFSNAYKLIKNNKNKSDQSKTLFKLRVYQYRIINY